MFEMTASFMLYEGGHREPMKKIPEFFPFLHGDGYLTAEHGAMMREWAAVVMSQSAPATSCGSPLARVPMR